MVRPAEVFRAAVVESVPAIIIAHNHPSGDPNPSPEDILITRKLKQAADLLDIELLDHVVIGGKNHVSLKSRGYMTRLEAHQKTGRRAPSGTHAGDPLPAHRSSIPFTRRSQCSRLTS